MRNLLCFVCLTTAINLLMVPSACSDWLMECGPCRCKWISGKKTADCKNTIVTRVPNGLSAELQVLDMSNNYVPEIQSNEFATANLRNLHKLFIRNATLKQVNRDSLKGLEILIELDLSYNLLHTLPRSVFNNLVKLRALMLNNNKLERLDDGLFRNLKFLHKIELKENVLARIETKAFANLPVLTQIYLDGNQLTVLRRECFEHLEKLTSLSLKQNPWNCTCELKPFRDFAFEQNLYTPPTDCHYPETLRGTLWTDVSIDAFACRPKIVYPVVDDTDDGRVAVVHASSNNVTITCRMEAPPSTAVTWTYNKHALAAHPKRIFIKNSSETSNGGGGSGGQDAKDMLTSELTIVGVRKSDEGTYTCSAQNIGGQMELDIQLQIGRGANSFFLTNQMMFVLCVIAVGLLIVSIVIMIVTCCYCRKFKNLIKHDLDEHNGTTSIGIDTANGSAKKHFQSMKLNSFNNATLIGNGSVIVGNTMVTTTCGSDNGHGGGGGGHSNTIADTTSLAAIVPTQTNGSITITGDCEKQKATSNEFIHANLIKSDMSVVDTHGTNNKSIGPMTDKLVVASENRLHYPMTTSPLNGVMASPTTTRFNSEHQLLNQMQHHQSLQQQQQQQQRHQIASNARLPPDLLPYGQHQSLALKNSLNNSSSSGSSGGSGNSGTSTVIIDHRTHTYRSNNKYEANAASYDDDIIDAMKIRNDGHDDDENGAIGDSDSGRLFSSEKHLIRRPSDEPDLRIYHHDMVGGNSCSASNSMKSMASQKPFSLLGASCSTTTMTIASGKTTTLLPSHRFKNYDLSSSSTATIANKNNNYPFYNNSTTVGSTLVMTSSSQPAATMTMASNLKSTTEQCIGNASTANCKPRQSIVRTSPSFSFLSTGYHQQQDNFL